MVLLLLCFLMCVITAILCRRFLIDPYLISDQGMERSIVKGDYILINKVAYLLHPPRRGDVVVFKYPYDRSKEFIKRVIGIPGDLVEGKDKRVYVNGQLCADPHELHEENELIPREQNPRDNFGPVKVPEDAYFVMGDNRDCSYDSRFWGAVRRNEIMGVAFIKYWSRDPADARVRWQSIGRVID